MRTTTIRLADRQAELLDELARIDGCKSSDVVRDAVRHYISHRAKSDAQFAAKRKAAVREEVAAARARALATHGLDDVDDD